MSARAHETEDRLLRVFRAASEMPWYRTLLDEHRVDPSMIVDAASFTRLCPVSSKKNTFQRFPLRELAASQSIRDLAGVLTSSGHGGTFAFGLITRRDAAAGAEFIDLALDTAFQVATRSTLAINCLPMGVGFSSDCMTVATTSVREDMAVALVEAFGGSYDQILLVADPLFLKRLIDFATSRRIDWSRHRIQVVIGEEVFGERFREYVGRRLGHAADRADAGYVMSSFGVGELGLHLCYETPATIAVRRAAHHDAAFAHDVLGTAADGHAAPMIFAFNPRRTFIEALDPDADGYGRMTVSMLDAELPIPLLRYQTGDVVRLLDPMAIRRAMARHGHVSAPELPTHLLALQGRDKERLPNGAHVLAYKDLLYADHSVAHSLTGACRLEFAGTTCTMHVQLIPAAPAADDIEQRLMDGIPPAIQPARVIVWPYERFPFGMTLDYERKFQYYVPGGTTNL
jgi:phenylacetate-CoA ligase